MPIRSLIVACAILASALGGCQAASSSPPQSDQSQSAQEPASAKPSAPKRKSAPKHNAKRQRRRIGTAAYMLKRIKRRPATTSTTYDRDYFGAGWETENGCSTRQWVLIKEARRGSDSGCRVRHGFWISSYDGRRTRDPSNFDIDHLVPLGEAWVSGASRWSAGTRQRYANDLGYSGTLRAVSATSNRSKGDADPASWMPPRAIHRCKYIGTWIAVKYRWHLTIDPAERAVLARYVKQCGRKSDVPIPPRARVRISKRPIGGRRPSRPHSGGKHSSSRDRRYATCAEVKARGLGPYVKGRDREYDWYTDRDRDGRVCE